MPATVEELFDGRREVFGKYVDILYLVRGAADEQAAYSAMIGGVPGSVISGTAGIIDPSTGGFLPLFLSTIEYVLRVDDTTWKLYAHYARASWTNPFGGLPDSRFAFDTTGGTKHITKAIANIAMYGPMASTKLAGIAIGFDGKNVNGVDITEPVYVFQETHYFYDLTVTDAFKANIKALTGHVNNDVFRTFDPGEVLFLGAVGSRQGDDPNDLWEITYRFAVRDNQAGITIGTIPGIAQKGWEVLWIKYDDDDDPATSQPVKTPVAVYIEQVYYYAALAGLGI